MPAQVFYVILTFYWIIIPVMVTDRSCSKVPAVEGRQSEIKCHFDDNLVLTRTKFNVYRHDDGKYPELVLTCHWPENGDALKCATRSGYTFDPFDLYTNDTHTIATIVIPYVSTGHAGEYSCQSSRSAVSTSSYTCALAVLGTKIGCTAGRVTEGERSTIVCHFNQDLHDTKGSYVVRHVSESGVHETVFACNWGKRSGKHVCAHASGYTLTSDITQSVAISIPKTMPQNGGQYRCVTVPEESWVKSESCNLEVTAADKDTTDPTIPISSARSTPVVKTSDTESLHSTKALLVLLLTISFYFGLDWFML